MKIKLQFLFFSFSLHQTSPHGGQSKKTSGAQKKKRLPRPRTVKILLSAAIHLLFHGIRFERFRSRIRIGNDAPDQTALHYATVCTVLPLMTSVLDARTTNGRIDTSLTPDFSAHETSFYGYYVLSVRPIDVLKALLHGIFS